MAKEDIFDAQIAPLLDQIHRICDEHSIAFVNSFFIGEHESETLASTGWNLALEANASNHFRHCAAEFLINVGVSKEDLFTGAMVGADTPRCKDCG